MLLIIAVAPSYESMANSRFEQLKEAVFSDPYEQRPIYKVERKRFGKPGDRASNHLRNAAKRTLVDSRDLLEFESGQKLLQANGICFAGQWSIDQPSEFTGLFAKGARSPVIVRASVALGGVGQKDKRAFGLAVKLLPDNLANDSSLNVFVLNSMGGVVTDRVMDLAMDNQPPLGRVPNWRDIRTALRMRKDLEAADKAYLSDSGAQIKPDATYRPVDHVAAHNPVISPVAAPTIAPAITSPITSPKWLRFSPISPWRADHNDFRDELSLPANSAQTLDYLIEVAADHGGKKSGAQWQAIGRLVLTESVISATCDTRLHFQHPTLR